MKRFDTPGGPPTPPRLPFDVPFVEAIAWAQARRAILPDEFYGARLQAVRARSFSIAGLAALDQLQDVADSLAAATAAGQTFREWQKALPAEVFELGAARRELIFRNAVQTHYGIGRTIQQRENAAARPFLMWDAINDSRTRPTHRAMDGHIAPVDDPIWKRWSPPAGHRCFLPGTRVRGEFKIGLKALYAGPAVEVLTRSGARLAVTGNHPILTRRGWVAAQKLKAGDDLLRYSVAVDTGPLPVQDDQQTPATVEEVFQALGRDGFGVAERAAFNLDGDASFLESDVDVVGPDGKLVHGCRAEGKQGAKNRELIPAVLVRSTLHPGIAKQTLEQAVTDAGLHEALAHGFPGLVSADEIVGVRHFTFRGHVYDFETKQGWLVADELIASNCRCSRVALSEAQARARGYPKAAPLVDPDKGWEGDPTEGNDDLVRIILERQASCATTFGAKKTRARGLWCTSNEAQRRMEEARAAVDNRGMLEDQMRQTLGEPLFLQAATAVSTRPLPSAVMNAGLSLAEKVAVHVWTLDTTETPWFTRINAMMRMADVSAAEFAAVAPVTGALLSALEKLPPFVGTVYRAVKAGPIGREAFEQFVREQETLPEVYHPGFVGASVAREGILRGRAVLTLQSVSGRDISSLSSKPEQAEILFRPPLHVAPEKVLREGKAVQIWAREI